MFEMATSMALGGVAGMTIGLGNNSPIIGGGLHSNGSIGSLTPSHAGGKYCGSGSGASSIHSPVSTPSSTPNSTITINTGTGSMGKCPGSMNSNMSSGGGGIGNNNSSGNIIANNSDLFGSKCKRKINFSNLGMPARGNPPATVARRNARERNRVKQVNNGFAALKQHIPLGHRSKKMSKVETLRCAVDYIRNLKGMLDGRALSLSSPAGSSASSSSGDGDDMLLMDEENQEQHPPHGQQQHQQQQMNGVNNQRDAFALSSSSSSSPTSSDFGAVVAHLPQHLANLHAHHHQQHHPHHHQQHLSTSNNNHLRHMSLSHHHLHGTNSAAVAAALLAESSNNGNGVTQNTNQLSPTSSDDPSSPSYASEASYPNSAPNIKYDYENYEPVSPEDEELLDAIAWWQQS